MPKAGGALEFGIMDVAGVVIMGGTMEWLPIMIVAGAVAAILDRTVATHHGRGRRRDPDQTMAWTPDHPGRGRGVRVEKSRTGRVCVGGSHGWSRGQ